MESSKKNGMFSEIALQKLSAVFEPGLHFYQLFGIGVFRVPDDVFC
jgi:hypothetical protein